MVELEYGLSGFNMLWQSCIWLNFSYLRFLLETLEILSRKRVSYKLSLFALRDAYPFTESIQIICLVALRCCFDLRWAMFVYLSIRYSSIGQQSS